VKLAILAIGKAGRGPERALYEHSAARLRWPLTLRELEEKRPLSPAELMRREGALLLAALPQAAKVVVLDRRGTPLASEALAARLGSWRDQGAAEVAFLIGGAEGHDQPVLDRADLLLSFGAATWPHLLARAMLAEQLYRAQQLLAGHPYHRG